MTKDHLALDTNSDQPSLGDALDRRAANGDIDHSDMAAIRHFSEFLLDPTSRCPICLEDDHTLPSQCPQVSEADKAAALPGVSEPERTERFDAVYANRLRQMAERLAKKSDPLSGSESRLNESDSGSHLVTGTESETNNA